MRPIRHSITNAIAGVMTALLCGFAVAALGAGRGDAAQCRPDGRLRIAVVLEPPTGQTIAGVVVDLDYPPRKLDIPGSADGAEVKARVAGMPTGFLGSPNDLDGDLKVALAGTSALPSGPIFTVEFDRCKCEAKPVVADFRCTVTQASTDAGVLVDGTRCRATIADDAATKAKGGSV